MFVKQLLTVLQKSFAGKIDGKSPISFSSKEKDVYLKEKKWSDNNDEFF